MESHELIWLDQFVSENWSKFVAFLEERGEDEAAAESFANKLNASAHK